MKIQIMIKIIQVDVNFKIKLYQQKIFLKKIKSLNYEKNFNFRLLIN